MSFIVAQMLLRIYVTNWHVSLEIPLMWTSTTLRCNRPEHIEDPIPASAMGAGSKVIEPPASPA